MIPHSDWDATLNSCSTLLYILMTSKLRDMPHYSNSTQVSVLYINFELVYTQTSSKTIIGDYY